jgi:hypothetical protein
MQPFPWPGGKTQISTDGGHFPRWARKGRELFYRNGDRMMAVDSHLVALWRQMFGTVRRAVG